MSRTKPEQLVSSKPAPAPLNFDQRLTAEEWYRRKRAPVIKPKVDHRPLPGQLQLFDEPPSPETQVRQ